MKRHIVLLLCIAPILALDAAAQDSTDDYTTTALACSGQEYLTELFAFMGRPLNLDASRPVTLLVNHGYMVGFSADRKQPVWAAYRVAKARLDTDYARPPFFVDDLRLPVEARIGPDTFSGFDRGHMVPNNAVNRQFGRLAQMETFLMSNVCPQKPNLNQGIWQRLEEAIVEDYAPARGDIWVLTGPIFPERPSLVRGVPVPSAFFKILVDVSGPRDTKIDILALRFPQETPRNAVLSAEFAASVDDLERATNLNFFPRFSTRQQRKYESEKADAVWSAENDGGGD